MIDNKRSVLLYNKRIKGKLMTMPWYRIIDNNENVLLYICPQQCD